MLRGGNPEKRFAAALAETVRDSKDILDIGTSQRFAKELRPYEGLFKGKRYVAAGYQPTSAYGAYSCDCDQDIENMTFADASFDAVLCIQVLEHVADPFAAARELARVLRPDGRLLLTTPFLYNYHGKRVNVHSPQPRELPGLLALHA
jgi:SAM-dependent methyltransferase